MSEDSDVSERTKLMRKYSKDIGVSPPKGRLLNFEASQSKEVASLLGTSTRKEPEGSAGKPDEEKLERNVRKELLRDNADSDEDEAEQKRYHEDMKSSASHSKGTATFGDKGSSVEPKLAERTSSVVSKSDMGMILNIQALGNASSDPETLFKTLAENKKVTTGIKLTGNYTAEACQYLAEILKDCSNLSVCSFNDFRGWR